ncbi:hypothetical protein PG997_010568 [Apiospora hydei]|uniref:Uncharacterized protein n=1 Tax=Apiospora hydei TaxID=1337664 RepID=A0ABR1VGP3_9PEZI
MDLQITYSPCHTKEDGSERNAWKQFVEGSCSEAKGTQKSWQIRTQDLVRMPPSWRQNLWALLWALLTYGARTRPLPHSLPFENWRGSSATLGPATLPVSPTTTMAAWLSVQSSYEYDDSEPKTIAACS